MVRLGISFVPSTYEVCSGPERFTKNFGPFQHESELKRAVFGTQRHSIVLGNGMGNYLLPTHASHHTHSR
jgi:hypothetical protein